jgi:Domain of unknown function (DUF4158)
MARRRLLNDAMWARLLEPATDEREMVRHYTLSSEDRALITAKRTAATQLGFAMMLLYLRYPGRVLAPGEWPPAPILTFVARQLGVSKGAFATYGRRDETRRKHLAELMHALGYQAFSQAAFFQSNNSAAGSTYSNGYQGLINLSAPLYQGGSEYSAVRRNGHLRLWACADRGAYDSSDAGGPVAKIV